MCFFPFTARDCLESFYPKSMFFFALCIFRTTQNDHNYSFDLVHIILQFMIHNFALINRIENIGITPGFNATHKTFQFRAIYCNSSMHRIVWNGFFAFFLGRPKKYILKHWASFVEWNKIKRSYESNLE